MTDEYDDDLVRPPNDSAFIAKETREGPSLNYVSEKIRYSIEAAHDFLRNVQEHVPSDLPVSDRLRAYGASIKGDFLLSPARTALLNGLVGYLALNNMLALANNEGFLDKIIAMNSEQLKEWLDGIDTNGSVTG